jgi:hypothetical protein
MAQKDMLSARERHLRRPAARKGLAIRKASRGQSQTSRQGQCSPRAKPNEAARVVAVSSRAGGTDFDGTNHVLADV